MNNIKKVLPKKVNIIIIIIIIFDKELNARGACLCLNSKKSNGNKRKNLLGKNERIGLQKKVMKTRA